MPTDKKPREKPAESNQTRDSREALSLVDFFDQMDRAAFRRALEHRDSVYPLFSNS